MSDQTKKEMHRVRQLLVTSGEREGGRGKIEKKDEEIQTTMYKINRQQGYIV